MEGNGNTESPAPHLQKCNHRLLLHRVQGEWYPSENTPSTSPAHVRYRCRDGSGHTRVPLPFQGLWRTSCVRPSHRSFVDALGCTGGTRRERRGGLWLPVVLAMRDSVVERGSKQEDAVAHAVALGITQTHTHHHDDFRFSSFRQALVFALVSPQASSLYL
ncbi:hypothetical protein ACN47E_005145 [Coniothyrium glycines]